MKQILFVVLLSLFTYSVQAQMPKVNNGRIKLSNTSVLSKNTFVGKFGDNYLLSTTNPAGVSIGKHYLDEPASLFLIRKDGSTVASNNLKEQLEKLKLKLHNNYGIIIFKDKILWIYSTLDKETKIESIFISEINPKTLQIDIRNKKSVSEELFVKQSVTVISSVNVSCSVSDDKSKLVLSISRYHNNLLNEKYWMKEDYKLLQSIVYDNDLNVLQKNSFIVTPKEYVEKSYEPNIVKVNNKGDVVTLLTYHIKQPKGPDAISSALHIHKLGGKEGNLFNIELPKDVLLGESTQLNINDNKIIVTGMPSVLEKNTYDAVVHIIIGYFNKTFNYEGQILGGNITSFSEFEASLPNVKGKDTKKQIAFKRTVLLNDGSYMMISQFYYSDIVIALYDSESKLRWMQVIPRTFSGNSHLGTMHDKTTDEVYIFFNDSEVKFGNFFAKVDKYGKVSDKQLVYKDAYTYVGEEADSKEYILYTSGAKIDLMYVILDYK